MNWIIAVLIGWAAVAVVLGLVIGTGVRIERGIEPELPFGAAGGAVPAAGEVHVTAPAETVGSDTGMVGADAPTRAGSLAGAR
jgi:hypothetical protein